MKAQKIREAMSLAGASEEAISLVLRATAPARHAARVAETREAALAISGGDSALALAVLVADLCGVGGTAGVTGEGTTRLIRTGKARWQASDGDAYLGAAIDALASVVAEVGPTLSPESAGNRAIPPAFRRTLAAQVCAAIMGAPAVSHCRLRFAERQIMVCARRADWYPVVEVGGDLEDWVVVLSYAIRQMNAIDRARWQRAAADAARYNLGRPLKRGDFVAPARLLPSWGESGDPIPVTLLEVLRSERPPQGGFEFTG